MLKVRSYRHLSEPFFIWQAREANTGVVGLTVGAFSAVMSPIASTNTVTAIDVERLVLTCSAPPAVPPGLELYGAAFLETPSDGTFPVEVVRVEGNELTLSRPLHRDIDLSANGTLSWATYQTQLGPGDVTADLNYDGIEWVVDYFPSFATHEVQDTGLLYVVRHPFTTGLTTHSLLARFSSLEQAIPQRQTGFEQQIDMAFTLLVQKLRSDLVERNLTEDDVQHAHDGLALVHAHLTMAIIMEDANQPEASQRHMDIAYGPLDGSPPRRDSGLYRQALRRVWLDADRKGEVEEKDITDLAGPSLTVASTGFPSEPRVTEYDQR